MRLHPLFLILGLFLAACAPAVPVATPTIRIDPNEVATAVAGTLAAELAPSSSPSPEPTQAPPGLLPHAVYFLSNTSGTRQVWRLAADGASLAQITEASQDVDSFAISGESGQLAYVAGNQLWLADSQGQGGQLLVDGSDADFDNDAYFYTQRLSAPRFSPDGHYLAFAHNGLQLLDLRSGESLHLLENQLNEDEGRLFPQELYFPEGWSPDGRRLLVSIGYLEGGSLAVYVFDRDELVRFQASGILCCQSRWTLDSASVLVASPYLGIVEPGLWRYQAADGAETVLVDGSNEEGEFHFFGWPAALPDGGLAYFYTSSAGLPEGDVTLFMLRGSLDGVNGREQLRPESFDIREALWAPDGSLALIIENPPVPTGGVVGGPIQLVLADGSPTQALAPEASAMQWGP